MANMANILDSRHELLSRAAADIVSEIRAVKGIADVAGGPIPVFEMNHRSAVSAILGLLSAVQADQTLSSVVHLLRVASEERGE